MEPKPFQKPHPPIWFGANHPTPCAAPSLTATASSAPDRPPRTSSPSRCRSCGRRSPSGAGPRRLPDRQARLHRRRRRRRAGPAPNRRRPCRPVRGLRAAAGTCRRRRRRGCLRRRRATGRRRRRRADPLRRCAGGQASGGAPLRASAALDQAASPVSSAPNQSGGSNASASWREANSTSTTASPASARVQIELGGEAVEVDPVAGLHQMPGARHPPQIGERGGVDRHLDLVALQSGAALHRQGVMRAVATDPHLTSPSTAT